MNRVQEYRQRIEEFQERIQEIQAECSHPKGAVDVTPMSSTGGYDVNSDRYWTKYYCTLCEKTWEVEK
jgi:hypothetical protein